MKKNDLYDKKDDILRMLTGCTNRMSITDDWNELNAVTCSAFSYLDQLRDLNCQRLWSQENEGVTDV